MMPRSNRKAKGLVADCTHKEEVQRGGGGGNTFPRQEACFVVFVLKSISAQTTGPILLLYEGVRRKGRKKGGGR